MINQGSHRIGDQINNHSPLSNDLIDDQTVGGGVFLSFFKVEFGIFLWKLV